MRMVKEVCRLTWFPPFESGKHLGDFINHLEAADFLAKHPEFPHSRVAFRMVNMTDKAYDEPSKYYTILSEQAVKDFVKVSVAQMLEDLLANS